jgi:hypothetical protein
MRRIRIVGLCLVASFAFGALVASAAQAAEPEWGRCVAQKKGEYTEGNCKTKSAKAHKGKFEWKAGAPTGCEPKKKGEYTNETCTTKSSKPHKGKFEKTGGPHFTGKGGKGILITTLRTCSNEGEYRIESIPACEEHEYNGTTLGTPEIECQSENATGELAETKGVKHVHVTFRECVLDESFPCESEGAAEGEVKTEELDGELGYIEKATHKVGVVLHPASGTNFAHLTCGSDNNIFVGEGTATQGKFYDETGGWYPDKYERGAGIEIPPGFKEFGGGHGIISPITPVDEMTTSFTQDYTTKKLGGEADVIENVPTKFEGGPFEALETLDEFTESPGEGGTWSSSGESITNVNTTEGPGEIKG